MQLNNLGECQEEIKTTSHPRLFQQSPVSLEAFSHSHFSSPVKAKGPFIETHNSKTETRLEAYKPVSSFKANSALCYYGSVLLNERYNMEISMLNQMHPCAYICSM